MPASSSPRSLIRRIVPPTIRPNTDQPVYSLVVARNPLKTRTLDGSQGANMCDQDHFEDDRQEYEARGLVTRRQFGVLAGSGHGDDAAAGRERGRGDRIGRERDDAGRHRRLLLRASGERHGRRRARVAGHLRAAAGVPPDGQAARRIGLFGARRESVLSRRRKRRPRRRARRRQSRS